MAQASKKVKGPIAKKPTDSERIDAILKLLKANGLTIPKELE